MCHIKIGYNKVCNAYCVVVFLVCFSSSAFAQIDTVKVMTYNVLNYGFPATNGCPTLITANKHEYLKTILKYENPDILGLVKITASPTTFTTDSIVHQVLDSVCLGCYGHSDFTNVSGYTKENMLYFKTAKFGLKSTTTIYSADANISDINMHTLFYKAPSLAQTHDTTFLYIILVHDKSGSSNASTRTAEIGGAMNWLNSHVTQPGNYIFMGDFNVQKSTEGCFQAMINSSNLDTKFYDPANQLGNWANNPSAYANYLTEDTRMTDPGDCGASGGMSTRFIHILCTQPLMQGSAAVQYLPNTYNVIGQDGNHVNVAINAAPTNTSVPPDVLNALFYMSNHLPVALKLAISYTPLTTGVLAVETKNKFTVFPNPTTGEIYIRGEVTDGETYHARLIATNGVCVLEKKYFATSAKADWLFDASGLPFGIYSLELISGSEKHIFKVEVY